MANKAFIAGVGMIPFAKPGANAQVLIDTLAVEMVGHAGQFDLTV